MYLITEMDCATPARSDRRYTFAVRHSLGALRIQTGRVCLYQKKGGVDSTLLSAAGAGTSSVEMAFKVYAFASVKLRPGSEHRFTSMLTSDTGNRKDLQVLP